MTNQNKLNKLLLETKKIAKQVNPDAREREMELVDIVIPLLLEGDSDAIMYAIRDFQIKNIII